jgi:hypothetical protein
MKNFDESRKRQPLEPESVVPSEPRAQSEAEVLPFRSSERQLTGSVSLLPKVEMDTMRERWTQIQSAFVDDPKNAVQGADKLVASAIQRLAETFSQERVKLENQWSRGDQVSTEDFRVALQRYRAFFERLLSI